MALIGYARISTSGGRQLLDRQHDALHAAGCERVVQDTASGADAARPGSAACLDHLRRHDVLDLDRLGRLAHDLLGLIDGLEQRGIGFKAINSPMDTTTRAHSTLAASFCERARCLLCCHPASANPPSLGFAA
jgi:DNA invertase Pin-like site-specific DNA recombinase